MDKHGHDQSAATTISLTDADIAIERRIGRRSALSVVGTLAAAAAVASVLGTPQRAEAKVTDNDPSDGANNGRGPRPRVTDSDPTDRANQGRRPSGLTDHDSSDPAGNGRGPSR
jgi:hypothetical protein